MTNTKHLFVRVEFKLLDNMLWQAGLGVELDCVSCDEEEHPLIALLTSKSGKSRTLRRMSGLPTGPKSQVSRTNWLDYQTCFGPSAHSRDHNAAYLIYQQIMAFDWDDFFAISGEHRFYDEIIGPILATDGSLPMRVIIWISDSATYAAYLEKVR